MDAVERQQTETLLIIDYAEEQLSLSDVQEMLHETRNDSILLQNVPDLEGTANVWQQLGQKQGWDVRIDQAEVWFCWRASEL